MHDKASSGTKEKVNDRHNYSVRLYDNDINEDYPLHCHTPLEIIMPIDNIYTVYCNHIKYTLQEGDILIISSGVLHEIFAPTGGRRYIILADLFPLYSMHEFEVLLSTMAPVIHVTNSAVIQDRLQRLIHDMASEYDGEQLFREAVLYTDLISFLVLICRNQSSLNTTLETNSSMRMEYNRVLIPVYNHINNLFFENITLDQAADMAGFSKYHFSRIFRQYTGISFYQYLNNIRIMQATKLLMETNLSIMEVSLQCGFSSLSSFIRMFKIYKGCTPSEFKEVRLTKNKKGQRSYEG